MNWKTEAVEKLRDYEAKKHCIDSIHGEIMQLKETAYAIRSATTDGTPVSGGGSRREDMLLTNIVKREELKRALHLAEQWIKTVEAGLSVLGKDERMILEMFYIHPKKGNVDRLCEILEAEKSTVYRRKDEALRKFTLSLYGIAEA